MERSHAADGKFRRARAALMSRRFRQISCDQHGSILMLVITVSEQKTPRRPVE
jgi:hypothetical protein